MSPNPSLTQQEESLEIGQRRTKSFERTQNAYNTHPILVQPNQEAPFKLETDTSGYATGAVHLSE